ncbi:hypothetical protein BD311DRAFT_741646 [Dichomitus squalens]|uniref:Uncharacterized protein n=1 Tax=Dichomitus squalens TaxID=114155 RepID=A0A4Q9MDQ6_9APHY|nr:hypothetical protein BD311DRAFT_729150 [Dichomitus squalens]TBU24729.1 hypothetical protein BD311DRAFT_741646 [Dichomitus squalens]
MVGTVKQKLYIRSVPPGMTLTITELNTLPPNPPEEWRAALYVNDSQVQAPIVVDPSRDSGYIGEVKMYGTHPFPINSPGARLEIIFKLTGTPTRALDEAAAEKFIADGRVENHLLEETVTDETVTEMGPIPADLPAATRTVEDWPAPSAAFDIKADDEGTTRAVSSQDQFGRIIVGTTKWGLVQRPDYAVTYYQWSDTTPISLSSAIPATIIGMPDPAHVVVGFDADKREIGINATTSTDVANTMASYAMRGILWANEKAAGWVLKFFWPF